MGKKYYSMVENFDDMKGLELEGPLGTVSACQYRDGRDAALLLEQSPLTKRPKSNIQVSWLSLTPEHCDFDGYAGGGIRTHELLRDGITHCRS